MNYQPKLVVDDEIDDDYDHSWKYYSALFIPIIPL